MANNHDSRVDHWANSPVLLLTARAAAIAATLLLAVLSYLADKTLTRVDLMAQQAVAISTSVAVQQTRLENHEKRLDRIEGPRER